MCDLTQWPIEHHTILNTTGLNVFERAPSTFQFLGLDFMVTRDLHTWFIEANNYPLWPKGTPFIDNLLDTLGVSHE